MHHPPTNPQEEIQERNKRKGQSHIKNEDWIKSTPTRTDLNKIGMILMKKVRKSTIEMKMRWNKKAKSVKEKEVNIEDR